MRVRPVDSIQRKSIRVQRAPQATPPSPTPKKTWSVQRVARTLRYPALVVTAALAFLPVLPQIELNIHVGKPDSQIVQAESLFALTSAPQEGHWLIIPKIGLNTEILEGQSTDTVDKGIWRKPTSAQPGQIGNTVLLGHRYEFTTKENLFYHLDKLAVKDTFSIDWDKHRYNYVVTETKVVEATDLSIESPTSSPIVTLYTCTPLLTGAKRLVVRATLVSN